MDLQGREEVLRALQEMHSDVEERKIRDQYGKRFAKVKLEVTVQWFDSLETSYLSEEIVAHDTPEGVVDAVHDSYDRLCDPQVVMRAVDHALQQGIVEELGEEFNGGADYGDNPEEEGDDENDWRVGE